MIDASIEPFICSNWKLREGGQNGMPVVHVTSVVGGLSKRESDYPTARLNSKEDLSSRQRTSHVLHRPPCQVNNDRCHQEENSHHNSTQKRSI